MKTLRVFATCCIDGANYRGAFVQNFPVNMAKVETFYKTKYRQYPDNEGIPAIRFMGLNHAEFYWVYPDERTRDDDYKYILDNFSL